MHPVKLKWNQKYTARTEGRSVFLFEAYIVDGEQAAKEREQSDKCNHGVVELKVLQNANSVYPWKIHTGNPKHRIFKICDFLGSCDHIHL